MSFVNKTLKEVGKSYAIAIARILEEICTLNPDCSDVQLQDVDSDLLDALVSIYSVDYFKARTAARASTFEEFSSKVALLEGIVGVENAEVIVRDGDFLKYKNGALTGYFKLANIVAGKLEHKIDLKSLSKFYSLTSLARVLDKSEDSSEQPAIADFNISKYSILHPDNLQSQRYLADLVNNGFLCVGSNEHWSKSKRDNGARGGNILKKVGHQLISLFAELNLPHPQLRFPPDAHKMDISSETQENLKLIYAKLYD